MAIPLGRSPIISLVVTFYRFMGFLEPRSKRRYLVLSVAIMNFFMFMGVIDVWGDMIAMVLSAFSAVLLFNDVVSDLKPG